MAVDPRPRYLAGGALFVVVAIVALVLGGALIALVFALVAAALFYMAGRVKTVP